jgi:hypothetical protein
MTNGSPIPDLVLVCEDGPSSEPSIQGPNIKFSFGVTPDAIATGKQRGKIGPVREQQRCYGFVLTDGHCNRGDA